MVVDDMAIDAALAANHGCARPVAAGPTVVHPAGLAVHACFADPFVLAPHLRPGARQRCRNAAQMNETNTAQKVSKRMNLPWRPSRPKNRGSDSEQRRFGGSLYGFGPS